MAGFHVFKCCDTFLHPLSLLLPDVSLNVLALAFHHVEMVCESDAAVVVFGSCNVKPNTVER